MQASRESSGYAQAFRTNLNEAIQANSTFRMTDVANFEWDRMYRIDPYMPREAIEEIIGTKLKGSAELTDELFYQLIFVKEDEVVLNIIMDGITADFSSSKRMTERAASLFRIEKIPDAYAADRETVLIHNVMEGDLAAKE
ncbi:hypothetical protein [Paenibacillus methanolicus]|uniref:hypothetical protein n=1 Tax=Paenibacillus methanolicus TaxID=582686 RepID=UPI0011E6D5E6|nr:hypothetical protein [Paenibacillus methanolicus]